MNTNLGPLPAPNQSTTSRIPFPIAPGEDKVFALGKFPLALFIMAPADDTFPGQRAFDLATLPTSSILHQSGYTNRLRAAGPLIAAAITALALDTVLAGGPAPDRFHCRPVRHGPRNR